MKKQQSKTLEDYVKWLNESPDPNDVTDSPEGGKHIPIEKLKPLLSDLDLGWGTENFKWTFCTIEDQIYCNASVELIVSYGGIKRRLTGACTFNTKTYATNEAQNTHFVAIALANSLKNAALSLGKKYGSELNQGDVYVNVSKKPARQAVKLEPDMAIRKQYAIAVAGGNKKEVARFEGMYNF